MYLSEVSILNYRNIEECELCFSPKINLFWGRNGVGKTNLMDVVYYLSFTKSHLNNIDSHLIRHSAEFFMIKGCYQSPSGEEDTVSASVRQRRKKQFLWNKKGYQRLADHIGRIPLVLVSPSDMSLIEEGSDERRRFMDVIISQYSREYLDCLMSYNAALKSRNLLLKQPENIDPTMLEVFDEKLVESAHTIFSHRKEFIEQFIPVFKEFYARISDSRESVNLSYSSRLYDRDLEALLRESLPKDKILGYTTQGIHRDDLEMTIDEFPIKRTGSQGQNKSFVVSMKLAQLMFLKGISGKTPILLLDDIFDKLDSYRVDRIIREISSDSFGQIFITDTSRENLDELIQKNSDNYAFFAVEDGRIINTEEAGR